MNQLFNLLGLLVMATMLATIVKNKNSATLLTAAGDAFDNSLKIAQG